jgi:hypothetical protein
MKKSKADSEISIAGHLYSLEGGRYVPAGYGHAPVVQRARHSGQRGLSRRVLTPEQQMPDPYGEVMKLTRGVQDRLQSARLSPADRQYYLDSAERLTKAARWAGVSALKQAHYLPEDRQRIRAALSAVSKELRAEREHHARANPKKRYKRSMDVQSVMFEKQTYTVDQAKRWLKEHGMRSSSADVGGGHALHFRQHDPSSYRPGTFRTISFGYGIKAVVGVPKRGDVGHPHEETVHRRGYVTKRGTRVKPTSFREEVGYDSRGPRARANPAPYGGMVYPKVRVDFEDGGHYWSLRGPLYRSNTVTGSYVIEDKRKGGDRVFPMSGRDVEVYLPGEEDPVIQFKGMRKIRGNPRQPARGKSKPSDPFVLVEGRAPDGSYFGANYRKSTLPRLYEALRAAGVSEVTLDERETIDLRKNPGKRKA